MFHFFEAITNTKGDALVAYYVRVFDAAGKIVPIYSDNNGTPIVTVSESVNACKTDTAGMADFYVSPGTYALVIYGPDSTTIIRRIENVPMESGYERAEAAATLSRLYAVSDADVPITGAVSTSDRGARYEAGRATTAAALAQTASSLAVAASLGPGGGYENAYATAVPQGVIGISITNAGTGYTAGTYALGVSGGPTGFAGTYTISGGSVASVAITNPGRSASNSAPTLSFPSGGGTGAAATATVGATVPNQSNYWAATSDSTSIGLYKNNASTAAAVNNPDGSQVLLPQTAFLNKVIQTPYIANPGFSSALARVVSLKLRKSYSLAAITLPAKFLVRKCGMDTSGAVKRLNVEFAQLVGSTYTTVAQIMPIGDFFVDAAGLTGIQSFQVRAVGTTLGVPEGTIIGEALIDLRDGSNFGTYYSVTFTHAEAGLDLLKIQPSATDLANYDERVQSGLVARSEMFADTATDTYAKSVFVDFQGAGMDPDDTPYLSQYRTYFDGATYYLAVKVSSTKRNKVVMQFEQRWIQASPPTLPTTIPLTLFYNGSDITNTGDGLGTPIDEGDTGRITLNTANVVWTVNTVTYTNANATAIRKGKWKTGEQIRIEVLGPVAPWAEEVTVGPTTGQYASWVAAFEAFEDTYFSAGQPISRSTFPNNYRCNEAYPIRFRAVDVWTETVSPTTVSGVEQSRWRPPHGAIVRGLPGCIVQNTAGTGAPTAEVNFSNVIDFLHFKNSNSGGYVLHVDCLGVITRGIRRGLATVLRDLIIETAGSNNASAIACGIGRNHDMVFERLKHIRGGSNTQPFIYIHTSPLTYGPGSVTLRGIYDPDVSRTLLSLATSHDMSDSIRHTVRVEDCIGGEITHGFLSGQSGVANYIVYGTADGRTIPAVLR